MDDFKRVSPKRAETPKIERPNPEIMNSGSMKAPHQDLPEDTKPKRNFLKYLFMAIAVIFIVAIIGIAGAAKGYFDAINYRSNDNNQVNFTVNDGDSLSVVSKKLEQIGLIKSDFAFNIYAKINNLGNVISGKYQFSSSMTIPEILKVLNTGPNSTVFSVTFLPGGTVKMAKKALAKAGFSNEEIASALNKDYSAKFPKLFEGKPADADLEGFLWGETHNFEKGASAEDIIERFLADFEKKIVELNLKEKFAAHGLNVYQGITLASIVQKESIGNLDDMKNIAGVFYNRMNKGMNLGSDVTYQYIADKNGEARDYNSSSPYNLRVHTGLTPTPISTPSVNALKAVADPAQHNYIYFLSGDDDKTYFGETQSQHESNIKNFCQKKCSII